MAKSTWKDKSGKRHRVGHTVAPGNPRYAKAEKRAEIITKARVAKALAPKKKGGTPFAKGMGPKPPEKLRPWSVTKIAMRRKGKH